MEDDRVVLEALEARQFLSGTGPLVHRHLIPRYHHGTVVRQWRFPSHTVEPDALVGHFEGIYTGNIPLGDGPLSLTFTKNSAGVFGGALSMVGLNFDKIGMTAYSNGQFILGSLSNGQSMSFSGSIQTSAGGMTLTGSYLGMHMADLFQGTFSLKKIG